MVTVKLGDIFEIPTPRGKAYIHYIYGHPKVGELIRVLQGFYSERPPNFDKLANSQERYMIHFPLEAAHKKKLVEKVGSYIGKFEKPRYMRTKHAVRGKVLGWFIVDTETLQRQLIEDLNTGQKKLSPWGTWNDTLLIERLVDDWSLESW